MSPRWGRYRPDTRTDEEREAAARHQERVDRARGRVGVVVETFPNPLLEPSLLAEVQVYGEPSDE